MQVWYRPCASWSSLYGFMQTTPGQEGIMQMAITFLAVVGGLIFSLAIALLAEEIIFGQIFRLFFASGQLAERELAASASTVKSCPKN
jgi:hypothetical protein